MSTPTGPPRDEEPAPSGALARLRAWCVGAQRPLRVAGFRNVAAGYTINELGNWLGEIALAVLVFDRTHSALATAALFLCARFVPALFAPMLTVRLERLKGTRVLPAPGGVILCVEPNSLAAFVMLSSTNFSAPVDDVLDVVRFGLTCERGKAAVGEGGEAVLPRRRRFGGGVRCIVGAARGRV